MKRSTKVRGRVRGTAYRTRWWQQGPHGGLSAFGRMGVGDASVMPWSFQDSRAAGWRFQDLDTGGLVVAGGRRNTNGQGGAVCLSHPAQSTQVQHTVARVGGQQWRR